MMSRLAVRLASRALILGSLLASSAAAQLRPVAPTNRPAAPVNPQSFGVIDGAVSDTALAPLQAAFVSILGTKIRVGTGANGKFIINKVPAGRYLVIVKRVGFRPASDVIDVAANDTARISYALEPAAVGLDAVVVTEKTPSIRMQEFEQRRRLGNGQFITQADIDKRNTVYPTELFRGLRSVTVSPTNTGAITEYFALSSREGGGIDVGACPMQVVLDQVVLPVPFNLELLPSPKDIAGIEVYSGSSTIPLQYSGMNRGCGLILVWTRMGDMARP